jgi:hypothetical protein
VCQSGNGYDTAGCDVVCDTSDCADNIKPLIKNNTNIFIKYGNYFLNHTVSNTFRYTGCNDISIDSNYAVLNSNKSNLSNLMTFYFKNCSNIKIENLKILGNKSCSGGNTCAGIWLEDVENVYLDNIEIRDMRSFQVFITATAYTSNVHVTNSIFKGIGTNDVIGGGPANANAIVEKVFIKLSLVILLLSLGILSNS